MVEGEGEEAGEEGRRVAEAWGEGTEAVGVLRGTGVDSTEEVGTMAEGEETQGEEDIAETAGVA